jgi:uncharacterized protein YidB (DUF937 family)
MGLFDNLGGIFGGALGQVEAQAAPALISAALAKTNLGDLQGLVNQLQQNGLQNEVQSWLDGSGKIPITADQLQAALGNEQVQQLARHFGIPIDGVLNLLAQHLPNVVDQASQQGTVQPGS